MQTCLVGHSEAGPFEDTGREQGHAVGGRPFPVPCLHLSAHPHFFILSLSLGLVFVVFLSTYSISLPRKSFSYILSVVATENVLADSNPSAILLGERIRGTGLHGEYTRSSSLTLCIYFAPGADSVNQMHLSIANQ